MLARTLVASNHLDTAAQRPTDGAIKPAKQVVASLAIHRPENAGIMNLVPARILLTPRAGMVSARVTRQRARPKPSRARAADLVLSGGDRAVLGLRPGTYTVQVITPVEDQPPAGYTGSKRPRAWQSPVLKLPLSGDDALCLLVTAGVSGASYDGSWQVDLAPSPRDCEDAR